MVSLQPLVFDPCDIELDSGSNVHIIDMLACEALIENAIVDTFVGSEVGLTGHFMKNNGLLDDAASVLENFAMINSSLRLAWSAKLHCRTFLIALFSGNKMNFRDLV